MNLRPSRNQEKFGGAGLKCPPEPWAARDGRPTNIFLLKKLFRTVIHEPVLTHKS